ncbi:MAG: hypothetical protein VB051_09665 [Candidatus Pelethousia sp.]|nr:hypothetical protein [Candidatus Pelethousia sp.]
MKRTGAVEGREQKEAAPAATRRDLAAPLGTALLTPDSGEIGNESDGSGLFLFFVTKLIKYRCADHRLAKFAQKNTQAYKILFREGGIKIVCQGRNNDI